MIDRRNSCSKDIGSVFFRWRWMTARSSGFRPSRAAFCRWRNFMFRTLCNERCAKIFRNWIDSHFRRCHEGMRETRRYLDQRRDYRELHAPARAGTCALGRGVAGWKTRRRTLWCLVGGAFFGESMFHRVTDASKIALLRWSNVCASRSLSCSIRNGSRRICCNSAGSRFRATNICACCGEQSICRGNLL